MSPGAARSQPWGGINSCSFVHTKRCQVENVPKKKTEIPKGGGRGGVSGLDRQTDRHVFIWGLIQRKYIDYNSK